MRFIFPDNQWNTSRLSSLPPAQAEVRIAPSILVCVHTQVWQAGRPREEVTPKAVRQPRSTALCTSQTPSPRPEARAEGAACVSAGRGMRALTAHLLTPIILISRAPPEPSQARVCHLSRSGRIVNSADSSPSPLGVKGGTEMSEPLALPFRICRGASGKVPLPGREEFRCRSRRGQKNDSLRESEEKRPWPRGAWDVQLSGWSEQR